MSVRNSFLCAVPSNRRQAIAKPVVFCDFDGPIVDVSERYYQTYRMGLLAIEQQYQLGSALQPLSKSQFWQMKKNRTADIEIAAKSGLPAALFDPFMQQVERIVNHPNLLRWDRVQPSAHAALRYFRQSGVRLVLVTLRHPRQVQEFLQVQGLTHLVDEVYGACDVRAALANRVAQKYELLTEAIAQQQAQGHLTQNSWMVGDTEADVLAGQSAGLSTAAIACGVRSASYLQHLEPTELYSCLLTAAHGVVKAARPQAA